LLIGNRLDKSVCVFNGDTHLEQIFAEYFVRCLMLGSLSKQELYDGDTHLSLISVKLLVSAKFADLFVVEGLACNLFYDLYEDKLELYSRDAVK